MSSRGAKLRSLKYSPSVKPGEPAGGIVLDALPVEGQDVAQHPEIGRRQQVAWLRKQAPRGFAPVDAAALPLEAAGVGGDRKAHAAFHGLDAEMGEQRRQVGIVQFVIDDEADIDRKRRPIVIDGDGVAVAAGPEFAIVDRDRIALRQGPGGGIAGNSRSDHRDPHSMPPSVDDRDTARCAEVSGGPKADGAARRRIPAAVAARAFGDRGTGGIVRRSGLRAPARGV